MAEPQSPRCWNGSSIPSSTPLSLSWSVEDEFVSMCQLNNVQIQMPGMNMAHYIISL